MQEKRRHSVQDGPWLMPTFGQARTSVSASIDEAAAVRLPLICG